LLIISHIDIKNILSCFVYPFTDCLSGKADFIVAEVLSQKICCIFGGNKMRVKYLLVASTVLVACGKVQEPLNSSVKVDSIFEEYQASINSYNSTAPVQTTHSMWNCRSFFTMSGAPTCGIKRDLNSHGFPTTEIVASLHYKKLQMYVDANDNSFGKMTFVEFKAGNKRVHISHRTVVDGSIGRSYVSGTEFTGYCSRVYFDDSRFTCKKLKRISGGEFVDDGEVKFNLKD